MTDITVESVHGAIKVKISGILHLWLPRKNLAVQSWRMDDRHFFIEFTFDGGRVTCSYDAQPKWQAILDRLEQVLWAGD